MTYELTELDRLCFDCKLAECNDIDPRCAINKRLQRQYIDKKSRRHAKRIERLKAFLANASSERQAKAVKTSLRRLGVDV